MPGTVAAAGRADDRMGGFFSADPRRRLGEFACEDALDGVHLDRREKENNGTVPASLVDELLWRRVPRLACQRKMAMQLAARALRSRFSVWPIGRDELLDARRS